jgi:putative DNA primase/helicase
VTLKLAAQRPASADLTPDLDSEQRLGALFAGLREKDLRYNVDSGIFMRWNGVGWEQDHIDATLHELGSFCADQSTANSGPALRRVRRWATVAGVANFVKVHPQIAARQVDFDADPYLLGVRNGVVDLRTGRVLPPDPTRLISRVCRVECAPPGSVPRRWRRALLEIMRGRRAMVRYLQRLFGYCLLGARPVHLVVFLFGGGGNGKSTIVETLVWLLGDYAAAAAMETFEQARGERHPTELARLAGVRVVTASENSHARKLNVELLKRLTGGDTIAARFMRADFFEFRPQFVPLLIGNHKPRLPAVDDGIARRLHFVPFDVRFDVPDGGLTDALRGEGAAILRWLVDGALAFQRDGLRPPEEVLAATRRYLEQQDLVGQWLEERCISHAEALTPLKALQADYADWARTLGAPGISSRALSDDLERRGFTEKKRNFGKAICGLRLRQGDLAGGE